MNERIRELAEQAGISLNQKDYSYYWVESAEDIEKFAELIVAECISICRDIDGEDNIDARSGRQDCAVEIREHFGVVE